MDEFLDSQGLFRKQVARDGSCLFRAVSEQVFLTQAYHMAVRMSCVGFLARNADKFEPFVDEPFEQHLENLKNPKEWAGHIEMEAMSLLYRRDFLVFQEVGKPPYLTTDHGFPDVVQLCYSHGNHYDCVYPKRFLAEAAICQSLTYEILYKRVFQLGEEVDLAVWKMLHDKAYSKLRKSILCRGLGRESFSSPELSDDLRGSSEEEQDGGAEIRQALAHGIPPFPYKVAKALDPEIYRNVEFDLWNEDRKEQIRSEQMIIPEYAPGVKCLVRLNKEEELYQGHIQDISPNKGPVTVYIEKLGEKKSVPYDCLEPLPIPAYKAFSWHASGMKSFRVFSEYFLRSPFPLGPNDRFKNRRKLMKKGKIKDIPLLLSVMHGIPFRVCHQPNQYSTPANRVATPSSSPQLTAKVTMTNDGLCSREVTSLNWVQTTTVSSPGNGALEEENRSTFFPVNTPSIQNAGCPADPAWQCPTWGIQALPSQQKFCNGNEVEQTDQESCAKDENRGVPCSAAVPTEPLADTHLPTTALSYQHSQMYVPPEASLVFGLPLDAAGHEFTPSSPPASSASPVPVVHSLPFFQNVPPPPHPSSVLPSPPLPGSPIGCMSHAPVLPGMIIHYGETSSLPVNLNALRSQDPSGSDLPLADLPTVRFFYNLGCDYFRMSSVVAAGQQCQPALYPLWAYNGNFTYAMGPACTGTLGGYPTAMPESPFGLPTGDIATSAAPNIQCSVATV